MFTLIAVVIDIGERIEVIIESNAGFKKIAFGYYLHFIPWINGILWPLYALISVIFFTSRMAANTEIIAMLNAGIRFSRILLPYMLAAVLLVLVHIVANHFVIPMSNNKRLVFQEKYFSKKARQVRNRDIHIFLSPNQKAYINYYNHKDSTGQHFRLESFDSGQLVEVLKAKRFELVEAPNRWRLKDYEQFDLREGKESLILGNGGYIDTTLELEPSDFVRFADQRDMMTTPELLAFMDKERARGLGTVRSMLVGYHKRNSEPVSLLILTVIGVALSSRKSRGGTGFNIALGLILGAIYIMMGKFADTISLSQNIPVLAGIWLPNLFFGIIAIFLVYKAQK